MNELTQHLNWEVNVEKLVLPGNKETNRFALVRSDNGEVLNICSDRYKPFYNRDLLHLIDRIEQASTFKLEGFEEFSKGRRILAFLKNDQPGILGGQKVEDYLIIGNSHNSTSKVFTGMSNYMFRCENQFSGELYSLRVKHVAGMDPESIDPQIILKKYHDNRLRLGNQVNEMMNTPFGWSQVVSMVDLMIQEAHPLVLQTEFNERESKRRQEILDSVFREMKDLGVTVWGFYNGITYYTSNILKGNGGFGNTNGLGERFNRLAWEYSQRAVSQINGNIYRPVTPR